MCTAQVLLLNRDVMRRNFGSDVNRRVCRKLFETSEPSPVGPTVFLKKMQEEIRKKDSERWNFDFMTDTPLPGRYQWEPVFAKNSSIKKQTTTTDSNSSVRTAAVEPVVEEIQRETSKPSTQTTKKSGAGASSQQKITAFMSKKKRRSAEENSSSKLKIRRVGRSSESLTTTTRLR